MAAPPDVPSAGTSADHHSPSIPLTATAQRLLALKEKIFDVWQERIRARVQQARALQEPILVDTLPAFFNNIVASVDPGQARTSAVEGTTMATEMGIELIPATTNPQVAKKVAPNRWPMYAGWRA